MKFESFLNKNKEGKQISLDKSKKTLEIFLDKIKEKFPLLG